MNKRKFLDVTAAVHQQKNKRPVVQVVITVGGQAEAQQILDALSEAEEGGKLDFAFNTEVKE